MKTKPIFTRQKWLELLLRKVCMANRLLLLFVLLTSALPMVKAEKYITDLAVLGKENKNDIGALNDKYKNQGYTIVNQDLNSGAGGYYIYLAYKTSDTANPDDGYVTDIIASTKNVSTLKLNNRTYTKVPADGFNGDLNKDAGGDYIYLYYTKERTGLTGHFGTMRAISKLETSSNSNSSSSGGIDDYGPIMWGDTNSGACDANRGCGSGTPYIYIRMYFKEQSLTIKTDPTFAEDLIYTGSEQSLLSGAATPSGNYGTMKYKVDNGSEVTVPKATTVGSHQVKYYLEGKNKNGIQFAKNSGEKTATVNIGAPTIRPSDVKGQFNQGSKEVVLTWDIFSNPSGYTGYKWVVYREGQKLGTVASDKPRTWTDTGFENETELVYYVYYVSNNWDEGTTNDNCMGSVEVNTTRRVPVRDLEGDPQNTYLAISWTSDIYPLSLGHKFKIYVDDETEPIITITPKEKQTFYLWEHRYTDAHTDRVNGSEMRNDTLVYYTEEQGLGACSPHDYRVVGFIGDKDLDEGTLEKKSIGAATRFYSFEATKGCYAGSVKLSWHIDNQGSTASKTYIVDRRTAERPTEAWTNIARVNSADENVLYTDETALPGVYYDYRVTAIDKCGDGETINTVATDIGFSQATGTVSGRVTYGTSGSSVENVEVTVTKASASSGDEEQYHALHFSNVDGYVTWKYPKATYAKEKFSTGDFTMQMWLYPEAFANKWIARLKGANKGLGIQADGSLVFCDGTDNYTFGLKMTAGKYSHVALTRSGNELTCYLLEFDNDGKPVTKKGTSRLQRALPLDDATQFELGYFNGYVDEFRLWTKCLSENDIKNNFDHLLVGNEKNLETYWTFDEGLNTQFFDYSREGTVYNQHHGKIENNVEPSTNTPNKLALKAKTDNDGNYIIQGIPFTGEGTNYNVEPVLNSHEFSPQKQSRFISASSLVHNSVDFNDISSFEVSGTIYYEGTNIPVDSVSIYVDGRAVSRGGKAVQTNEDGEFIVDVPIGLHYLTAVRDGHTFVNDGRIPEDPAGLNESMQEFKNPLSGLRFFDNTLVPVAGRIVGGAIEGEKPLGFGLSSNNIGKAIITLEIPDPRYMINAEEKFENNVSKGYYPVANDTLLPQIDAMTNAGVAYRNGGQFTTDAQTVTIITDAATGEFGAMLPPLDYKVLSVQMENAEARNAYKFDAEMLPRIDASDAATVLQDSVLNESGDYVYFDYVASFMQTVHTDPVLSVTQNKQPEGVFGNRMVSYLDPMTKNEEQVEVYANDNGSVTYNFDYPVFGELGTYTFNLEGYELYTNYEKPETDQDRVAKVPLRDVIVTISNALSASQEVQNADDPDNAGQVLNLKSNQLMLDSVGKATYQWRAGLPNIQWPYTRKLNMTYSNGAGEYKWHGPAGEGLEGIIFGDLPSGTNFTTEGPSEVEMILHDPYGDSSFASWETGKVTVESKDTLGTHVQDNSFMFNGHLGPDFTTNSGFGVSVQTTWDVMVDPSIGFDRVMQNDTVTSHITTLEATRAISTSSDPEFVGANGDLYIGKSSNLLFGKARSVGLKKNDDGTYEVGTDDAIIVGKKFHTNFVYTEYQIENVMIPNLKQVRNDLLIHVADTETATNDTNENLYVTTLTEEDPNFGQPGTYKVLMKQDGIDMVGFYNDQIKGWRDVIKQNEEYKVELFKKNPDDNLSFGGGSEITNTVSSSQTYTKTISYTHNWTVIASLDAGFTYNGLGFDVATENNTTWENTESEGHESTTTATFSYTLADSGADDSFTMDIYKASGNHGPVFRTMGGQSSCPYEDQVVTKYYKPGTELSTATWKIEDPELACDNNMLTGVPTGGKAQFELLLRNNSITNTDNYFNLVPVDGTNPLGAKLSLPTGPIGNGRTVYVPAGETVKMILTLEQGNIDITKYDDIQLAMTSTCQDDIASTVSISAEFVPASTPVNMTIDKMVVNTSNVNDELKVRVTGFDRNFAGLKSVNLQYMAPGDQSWSLLESYIPSDEVRENAAQKLLPANGVIDVSIDMKQSKWIDGIYQFRAQSSALFAGSPVTTESDILTVVKDLSRPQLFGAANPTDGILNADDEISVTFNEDIQKEMLIKNNIIVSGVLNGDQVQHDVALSAQNTERAAYTEAGINLAQKSFSGDVWVRVTAAGDIFTHGNGDEKFKLSVDANNHLVVTIGNDSYTSEESIDKETWTFIAFSYNYESGNSHLKARAVTANGTKDLFYDKPVADYRGTGAITLGQNFSGAMHELTLWDKSREMQEAQAEMHYTKKPSTPNLIGYWKMDEGEGKTIRDYARNRHMTLPADTWYLNNDNKAVSLNGANSLKLNISECNALPTEDYAVEMWFKGAKADQSTASTLFSATEQSVSMGFNASGALTMIAGGSDIEISKNNYLDNAWHHLALNVLRNGNATVYVDGTPVKTMTASTVPALEGAWLYVGSKSGTGSYFKGTVDEVRFWKASMTGDLISSQRTQRLNGDESGLVAYYSFEKLSRDPVSGIISSVSNATDLSSGKHDAEMSSGSIAFVDEAPAMKVKPEATNVEYSFVANERGIIITLNEAPARLEGTTLQFTVRGVQDLNGNESEAIMWSAFVRQNNLLWKDVTEVNMEKEVGEPATFEATFTNESGLSENWSLSGLPAWLTADATSGSLKATMSKTITFTVSESIPIGKYEETIYLTGNSNISEPLTLYLKVTGDKPEWAFNKGDYKESMNLIANIYFQDEPSMDSDDMVAAFIDGECRGVAQPEYKQRYDNYFITMDIYANANEADSPVEFKMYDASTGTIYPLVKAFAYGETNPTAITFETNTLLGRYYSPYRLDATDEVEQSIELGLGWNWMSLGVKPDDLSVENVFAKANGKVEFVKSNTQNAEFDGEDWLSEITAMNNREMYTVQTNEALTLNVTGHRVNPADEPITVNNGWSWVAFNQLAVMSLGDALADMQPQDDEIIKGQRGVAYYDSYEWSGSLTQLTPGQGYKIFGRQARTFTYPTMTAAPARANSQFSTLNSQPSLFTPVDYHNYPTNMVVIAQVVFGSEPVAGAEVGIFAGDECREAAVTDDRGMIYVTVPGNEPTQLNFIIATDGKMMEAAETITYETDAVCGMPRTPFVIDLGNATAIHSVGYLTNSLDNCFDLQGRRVNSQMLNSSNRQMKGVYIINGQKRVK
ncbi:MAG: hypothetical protein II949_06980 [Prevotella sp.]|nr:hypothetical protein [Prevotella sp.]